MTFYDVNAAIDKPNIVNSLRQGFMFGQQKREIEQQEADRNELRRLAPGILSGDPNAYASAAAIDPQRAQQTQQAGDDQLRRLKGGMDYLKAAMESGDPRRIAAAEAQVGPYVSRIANKPWQPGALTADPAAFEQAYARIAMLPAQDGDTAPADVQSFEYFAKQAGLAPGTPEYAEAAARYGKLVEEEAKDPNSFREWQLAQENPEYAAHLAAGRAARQGPVVTVQNPGMSLSYDEEGRPIVGFGGGVTKPTATKVEQDIIAAKRQLESLRRLGPKIASDYLTYQGRAEAVAGGIQDKLGMNTDMSRFAADRSAALQEVEQFFNQYRKQITGAAAAVQELEALKKAVINSDLGPQEFQARYDALVNSIEQGLVSNVEVLGGQVADAPQPPGAPSIPMPNQRITDNNRVKGRYGF